jgi:hypothetical protein
MYSNEQLNAIKAQVLNEYIAKMLHHTAQNILKSRQQSAFFCTDI